MANTSQIVPRTDREIFYFRQRYRNRIFQAVIAFFAKQASVTGVTQKDIAIQLNKNPSQISRWFAGPGNWTLDTVSDLLLALDSEMSDEIVPFDSYTVPKNQTASAQQIFGLRSAAGSTTSQLVAYG